jgi:hypothetical protein
VEVVVCFVDIDGIVDHHYLEMIFRFVDIGGIDDQHCLDIRGDCSFC